MRRFVLIALALASTAAGAQAGEASSRYRIADPSSSQRVDYLILSADAFAGDLDRLAAHREAGGLKVGIVALGDLKGRFDSIRAFLRHTQTAWTAPAPRFLFIVGDAEAVPTVRHGSLYRGPVTDPEIATDYDYALAGGFRPVIHVGRFPGDTTEELAAYVDRVIRYETSLPAGPWQRQVRFVLNVPGYDPTIDALIEHLGTGLIAGAVPPVYEIEAVYAKPDSPYCPAPPHLRERAVGMLEAGPLFWVYIGHGAPTGVAGVPWHGREYPLLEAEDAARAAPRPGLPVVVMITCSTGRFDRIEGLGERFVENPRGPVAFIGASRKSHPYANLLFGEALARSIFDSPTIGEALTAARLERFSQRPSPLAAQADLVASAMFSMRERSMILIDNLRHYQLLGDPALRLRRPAADITVTVEGSTVTVEAPAGVERVTLELATAHEGHAAPVPEADLSAEDAEAQMDERYRAANTRTLWRRNLAMADGRARTTIDLPESPGRYFLRAFAGSSAGAAVIMVPAEAPASKEP